GRVDFVHDESIIAYADSLGFWPGDVFGVLPLPDTLALPNVATAYVVLRDPQTGELLIESGSDGGGMTISTRAGRALPLVIPALRLVDGGTPAVDVVFALGVNAADMRVMSGSIEVMAADEAPPLFALQQAGLDIEVRGVAFRAEQGGYALF